MSDRRYPFLYVHQNPALKTDSRAQEGGLNNILDITPALKQKEEERRQESYARIAHLADHLFPDETG